MDFNIYVFLILVGFLLFLIINDIFKFINIVNLFDGLLYLYIIVISIVFVDINNLSIYFLVIGIGLILYLFLTIYSYFSKKYFYLLLKYCKKDYNIIKKTLESQNKANFSFSYNKKIPFIIIINNPDKIIYKNLKLAIKKIRTKNFSIFNYWQIIILIVIITIIVRF
ncbi:MAG: hypothetical protein ACOCV1_02855 [Bacillota bacterium]